MYYSVGLRTLREILSQAEIEQFAIEEIDPNSPAFNSFPHLLFEGREREFSPYFGHKGEFKKQMFSASIDGQVAYASFNVPVADTPLTAEDAKEIVVEYIKKAKADREEPNPRY